MGSLIFAPRIGKAGNAHRATEAKALSKLRIDINLRAVPRAHADKRCCTHCILNIVTHARLEDSSGMAETVIKIFEPRRPIGCNGELSPNACDPAGARRQRLVLSIDSTGCLKMRAFDQAKPPVA